MAIAIVIFHFGTKVIPFSLEPFKRLLEKGSLGVSYFFLLSGFVMAITYYSEQATKQIDKKAFWISRFARIYPLYLFSLLLTLAVDLFMRVPILKGPLLLHVALLQAWGPKYVSSFNPPAWAVSVEIFFFLMFPFIITFFTRKTKLLIAAITGIFWFFSQVAYELLLLKVYVPSSDIMLLKLFLYSPLLHINSFIMGTAAGVFYKTDYKKPMKDHAVLWLLLVLILLVLAFQSNYHLEFHNGLLAPLFAIFLLALSLDSSKISEIMSSKPLMQLGEYSYAIYILQEPVHRFSLLVSNKIGLPPDSGMRFYFFLILLLPFSSLSYHLIERPSRDIIKRVLIRR
ncbi:MAG: acyltransferase [Nitrospirae bacterium]|nr:acyltransferase [Nitrospirota bacterium]